MFLDHYLIANTFLASNLNFLGEIATVVQLDTITSKPLVVSPLLNFTVV